MDQLPDILIVDDDERICRVLKRYLEKANYQVRFAYNGAEMRLRLEEQLPDLILLDLNLPDANGLDLAKEIRSSHEIGIIIITGSGDVIDKVVGLEVGADDYVSKPFDERELLARIRSVMRRTTKITEPEVADDHSKVNFSGWELDLTAYSLSDPSGNPISLTSHEFQLLAMFVKSANKVLSRDQIMNSLSGRDWYPSDRSVDALVSKLRKKIENDPGNPALITTIRGAGYMFTTRVLFT